ncbi:hypothetical protein D3C87_2031650 [compost metagenome]
MTNARHLEEGSIPFKARALIMRRGAVAFDPIMPEAFLKEGGFGKAVVEKAEPYVDKALDKVKDLGSDIKGFFVGLFN